MTTDETARLHLYEQARATWDDDAARTPDRRAGTSRVGHTSARASPRAAGDLRASCARRDLQVAHVRIAGAITSGSPCYVATCGCHSAPRCGALDAVPAASDCRPRQPVSTLA